jgi:hypothetical protein
LEKEIQGFGDEEFARYLAQVVNQHTSRQPSLSLPIASVIHFVAETRHQAQFNLGCLPVPGVDERKGIGTTGYRAKLGRVALGTRWAGPERGLGRKSERLDRHDPTRPDPGLYVVNGPCRASTARTRHGPGQNRRAEARHG